MTEGHYVTKSGRVLTDPDLDALAAEAEAGYDVDQLRAVRALLPGERQEKGETMTEEAQRGSPSPADVLRELLERHGETIRRALENEIASANEDAQMVGSLGWPFVAPEADAEAVLTLEAAKKRLTAVHLARIPLAAAAIQALDAIEDIS